MSEAASGAPGNPQLAMLRQRALDATAQGRSEEASRLWQQVLSLSAHHPEALQFMAQQAMRRGDGAGALALLQRAARGAPGDVMIQLNLSHAARAVGDRATEMRALDGALAADPKCFPALLAKSELLERAGEPRQAARIARDAMAITPPDERLSPSLARMAADARQRIARNAEAFGRYLQTRMAPEISRRMAECLAIATGTAKPYVQQPTLLNFPGLPAIAFHDNAQFPWLGDIEDATDAIGQELAALLREDAQEFAPYVAQPAGVPLEQWAALNHSPDWNAYFLWKDGKRLDDHCRRCPKTAALLEAAPMAAVPDVAPSAFFSVLAPHAHIPAHTGVTNTRLIVHLPLIVPENCAFRVGNHKRKVERGKAWVFDDSIEHEAWNESDSPRIILIFDIWNPLLNAPEREAVAALVTGMADYYRQTRA